MWARTPKKEKEEEQEEKKKIELSTEKANTKRNVSLYACRQDVCCSKPEKIMLTITI
jgi:hypothetical protein